MNDLQFFLNWATFIALIISVLDGFILFSSSIYQWKDMRKIGLPYIYSFAGFAFSLITLGIMMTGHMTAISSFIVVVAQFLGAWITTEYDNELLNLKIYGKYKFLTFVSKVILILTAVITISYLITNLLINYH